MKNFLTRLQTRLVPFMDLSAWVLLIVACVPLLFTAPAMLVTLAQWVVFGLALAGVAVMLSRVVLPQIKLNSWLNLAANGSVAAAIVVAAVIWLLSIFFLGLVLWAKT